MDQLCTPTRRYQDLWEECTNAPFEYTEVQLAVHVPEFLIYHWDWEALGAFLIGGVTPKIMWITENTFLVVEENENDFDFDRSMRQSGARSCIVAKIQAASGQEETLILAQLEREDISTGGEVSIFWRALANSNSVKLTVQTGLEANQYDMQVLPSGPILSQFLRESPSLQVLEFDMFDFKEEHCRALATLQRQDLKVVFSECSFKPKNAKDTFIEWFRYNQVVTELDRCKMGKNSIIGALSGNNSVKQLTIGEPGGRSDAEEIRSLTQALPGNMGIEHLMILSFKMSDETWSLLFRSLSTHPRINCLSFTYLLPPLTNESNTTWANAILQMLHLNTVIHTIELSDFFYNEEMYQPILPRLEMNRTYFEVQRQAVKRADPSIRPQLLGRALFVVRYNPELIFLFLSENVPAFVRTYEEDNI
jgi:hypothetical protein